MSRRQSSGSSDGHSARTARAPHRDPVDLCIRRTSSQAGKALRAPEQAPPACSGDCADPHVSEAPLVEESDQERHQPIWASPERAQGSRFGTTFPTSSRPPYPPLGIFAAGVDRCGAASHEFAQRHPLKVPVELPDCRPAPHPLGLAISERLQPASWHNVLRHERHTLYTWTPPRPLDSAPPGRHRRDERTGCRRRYGCARLKYPGTKA